MPTHPKIAHYSRLPITQDANTGAIVTAHGWPITYEGISYKCTPLARLGVYGFSTDIACAREIMRLVRVGKISTKTTADANGEQSR